MSAEIINLRQYRKQRARDGKAEAAAENRVRFGRTRAEREQEAKTQARAEEALDGHAREPQDAFAADASSSAAPDATGDDREGSLDPVIKSPL